MSMTSIYLRKLVRVPILQTLIRKSEHKILLKSSEYFIYKAVNDAAALKTRCYSNYYVQIRLI